MKARSTLLAVLVAVAFVLSVNIAAFAESQKVCDTAVKVVGQEIPDYYERQAEVFLAIDPDYADIAEDYRISGDTNRALAEGADCAVPEDLGIERFAEVEALIESILSVEVSIDEMDVQNLTDDEIAQIVAELEAIDVPTDPDQQLIIVNDVLDRVANGELDMEALAG